MSYLIFASPAEAAARSAAAWQALGTPAGATRYLWAWQEHPADGRAALRIPPTAGEAQIDLSQGAYDALLAESERAALVPTLSADWFPETI